MTGSRLENIFAWHLQATGLDQGMQREYRFHATRKWRFDFAWPAARVALEVEGMVWRGKGGRHQRAVGFEEDCRKYAEALCLRWRVLRVTGSQIKSGEALKWLKEVMENE